MVPSSAPKAGDKEGDEGEGTVTLVPSSKKEASVRRRELLAFLREPLREACAAHAEELMRSRFAGASVLLETVRVCGVSYFMNRLHYCCVAFGEDKNGLLLRKLLGYSVRNCYKVLFCVFLF